MIRIIDSDDVPKRERNSESLFEPTPQWKGLKPRIDSGIQPGKSLLLQFNLDDWERIGLSAIPQAGRNTSTGCKAVTRFIQSYLKRSGLTYKVRSRHVGAWDYVIVDGPKLPKPRKQRTDIGTPHRPRKDANESKRAAVLQALAEARAHPNLSEIAKQCGCTRQYVSLLLRGGKAKS